MIPCELLHEIRYLKVSCRREAARRVAEDLLSHSRSLKVIRNYAVEEAMC